MSPRLTMIRELYDIDQDEDGDLATRRRERSKDVLDRLTAWLMAQAVLKKSSIGSAIIDAEGAAHEIGPAMARLGRGALSLRSSQTRTVRGRSTVYAV